MNIPQTLFRISTPNKLKGEAKESDAFGQIVEVVEPNAGDLDLLRVKGGEKTNNELRIVEVEFLETLKK